MEETQADKRQSGPSNQKEISRRTRLRERLRNITLSDALMVIFTGVIARSTIVYTLYAKRQWQVMGEQLNEVRKGSDDTKMLAESAKRQAGNTEKLALSAAEQSKAAQINANAATDAAKAANKSAEIASKTLVASERAWVLFDSVDLKQTLRSPDGKRAGYQVIFRNFGKGPATNVSICAEATDTVPNWKSYNCDIHTEVVAVPGGEVPIVVTGPAFPDAVKQVYIWGAVKYLDQFGIARYTEYCATPHTTLNNRVAVGPCDHTRAK